MPLLLIHSTDDEVVAFEHAETLAAFYPDAKFWKVEDYGHVEAYSHPEYRKELLDFLESVESRRRRRRETCSAHVIRDLGYDSQHSTSGGRR